MFKNLRILVFLVVFGFSSQIISAQKDITQFLGIGIDGLKSEIIQKLKEKGFVSDTYKKDVLDGEFNGTNVNLHVVTNNNRVYRIMVADKNSINETDIKIRFNTLIEQFRNNKKYLPVPDAKIEKYIIPEEEDISYELTVKNKRYEAVFYQKSSEYNALEIEIANLYKKETLNTEDKERLNLLSKKMVDDSFKKTVWFMISERYGKYFISIYYDNEYNKANGEGL